MENSKEKSSEQKKEDIQSVEEKSDSLAPDFKKMKLEEAQREMDRLQDVIKEYIERVKLSRGKSPKGGIVELMKEYLLNARFPDVFCQCWAIIEEEEVVNILSLGDDNSKKNANTKEGLFVVQNKLSKGFFQDSKDQQVYPCFSAFVSKSIFLDSSSWRLINVPSLQGLNIIEYSVKEGVPIFYNINRTKLNIDKYSMALIMDNSDFNIVYDKKGNGEIFAMTVLPRDPYSVSKNQKNAMEEISVYMEKISKALDIPNLELLTKPILPPIEPEKKEKSKIKNLELLSSSKKITKKK